MGQVVTGAAAGQRTAMRERIRALGKRRVVREGLWAAGGQVVSAAALLGGTRLVTQVVREPEIMGMANLLVGVMMFARNVTCAPVLQAQYRFYPEFAARGEVRRLRRLAMRALGALVAALVGAGLIAGAVHAHRSGGGASVFLMYVALAGMLVVEVGRTLEVNFFQAARRQKPITVINATEAAARPLAVTAMILLVGRSPLSVLLGYVTGSGLVYVGSLLTLKREGTGGGGGGGESRAGWHDPVVRELWRYALPLVPLACVGWVTGLSDRYILDAFLGTKEVGIYTMTYGLMSQPFLIATAIVGRTVSPIYNKAVADGDEGLARRTFRAWLWGTAGVCGAGFVGVVLLRGLIARLLLAEKFQPGAVLMPWIAAGYALYAVGTVFEGRLYARKLTGRVLAGNAIVAATSIVAPVALLYKWGMLGVAAACPVYFAVHVLVMWKLSSGTRGGRGRPS